MNLNLITIGDVHASAGTSLSNLTKIKNYVNGLLPLPDIVVILGDLADDALDSQFQGVKTIYDQFVPNKFAVIGNHDIVGTASLQLFESYFGISKHVEHVNGYQLIFVGMYCSGTCLGGGTLYWNFNFNDPGIDKSLPTVIFMHGSPISPPPNTCGWPSYFTYGIYNPYDIKTEFAKFSDLIAVYFGHVHLETEQAFDIGLSKGVRFISNGVLTNKSTGCTYNGAGLATNNIGQSLITPTSFSYNKLDYTICNKLTCTYSM